MRKIFLILAVIYGNILYGQNITVDGVVTDVTGEVLAEVNIMEKGTTKGTITGVNGQYKLTISSKDAVLVYSYMGFTPVEQKVGEKTTINVKLSQETKSMNEDVVIGYGTVQRKDLTGSVSSVTGEDLNKVPVQAVASALAGRLAGVQVSATERAAGAEISIKVRGGGLITPRNEPLDVIDGVPHTGGLSFLDPTVIERIDLLNDAASTAVYGARG